MMYYQNEIGLSDIVIGLMLCVHTHGQNPSSVRLYGRTDDVKEEDNSVGALRLKPTSLFELNELGHAMIHSIQEHIQVEHYVSCWDLLQEIKQTLTDEEDAKQVAAYIHNTLQSIQSPHDLDDILAAFEGILASSSSSLNEGSSMNDQQNNNNNPYNAADQYLIKRQSVFGMFLRQILVIYHRGMFTELSHLFHHIQDFLHGYERMISTRQVTTSTSKEESMRTPSFHEVNGKDRNMMRIMTTTTRKSRRRRRRSGRTMDDNLLLDDPSNESFLVDETLNSEEIESFCTRPSKRQIQMLIHEKISALERNAHVQSMEELDDDLLCLLRVSPNEHKIHFVRYLNFLHHNEFQGALDALHRYHDYSLRANGSAKKNAVNGAETPLTATPTSPHHAIAAIQYACLNLAACHLHFGHVESSLESMQEAIRIAQQQMDHVCVAFALAWLMRLYMLTANPHAEQLVLDCLRRADEMNEPVLQILANLTSIEYQVLGKNVDRFHSLSMLTTHDDDDQAGNRRNANDSNQVGSFASLLFTSLPCCQPLEVWRQLNETATKACLVDDSMTSLAAPSNPLTSPSTILPFVRMNSVAAVERMLPWKGKVSLLGSAVWKMYGHRPLEELYAELHLLCFTHRGSKTDLALAIYQIARIKLDTPSTSFKKEEGEEEEEEEDYEKDANKSSSNNNKSSNKSSNKSKSKSKSSVVGDASAFVHSWNVYLAVLRFLHCAGNTLGITHETAWKQAVTTVFLLQAMRRGECCKCEILSDILESLSPRERDVNAYLEACYLSIQMKESFGRVSEALAQVQELQKWCDELKLQVHLAHLLVLESCILTFHCAAYPTTALPVILRSLSLSQQLNLDTLNAEAHVYLACLRLSLNEVDEAIQVGEQVIPHIVAHGKVATQGHLFLVLAKCFLAKACQNLERNQVLDKPSSSSRRNRACAYLKRSFEAFSSIEHVQALREVTYLQARLYDDMNDVVSRNSASEAFVAFHQRCFQSWKAPMFPLDFLENAQTLAQIVQQESCL